MRARFNDFGPETHPFPAIAKRRGSSAAWRMPMRARHHHAPGARSIVAQLQGRFRIEQIQSVVRAPRNSQRLAQTAGAACQFLQLAAFRVCGRSFSSFSRKGWKVIQAAIPRHLLDPNHRLQGANQHASSAAHALARDIHAEVQPIDEINIRMSGGSEEHLISRCGPTKRVRRRISRRLGAVQDRPRLQRCARPTIRHESGARALCRAADAPRAPAAPQKRLAAPQLSCPAQSRSLLRQLVAPRR